MINLIRTEVNGQQVFDLDLGDELRGQTAADAAAQTFIYAALFSDARAPESLIGMRVKDSPRGWWADPQAGSGLWHVRRQVLGSAARDEAVIEVRRALQSKAPALTSVVVRDVRDAGGAARNVSVVVLEITGLHNGEAFLTELAI